MTERTIAWTIISLAVFGMLGGFAFLVKIGVELAQKTSWETWAIAVGVAGLAFIFMRLLAWALGIIMQ